MRSLAFGDNRDFDARFACANHPAHEKRGHLHDERRRRRERGEGDSLNDIRTFSVSELRGGGLDLRSVTGLLLVLRVSFYSLLLIPLSL